MRIFINILISFLLIVSTTGIYVSEHYCNNHLVSVSFYSNAKKCCDGDCPFCKNINHTYKVKTKFVQPDNLSVNQINNTISLFALPTVNTVLLSSISVIHVVKINPPPGKSLTTVCLSKLRL